MSLADLSHKQRLALAMSAKGLRDHEIAATMGLRSRESACRLRSRGMIVIDEAVKASGGRLTREQVIAALAESATIHTPSLELAIAG